MNNQKNYMYLKNLNNDFYDVERFNVSIVFADTTEDIDVHQIIEAVIEHSKLYQTCKRTAFNRFIKQDLEFKKKRDLERHLQKQFPFLSLAYIKDAIFEAENIIKSQKELIEFQIESLEKNKLDLKKIMQPLNEHSEKYQYYLSKWQKILKKLKNLKYQQRTGKYKIVFSGRKQLEKLRKNPNDEELRVEWDFHRNRVIHSRGDVSKTGNLNIRIIRGDDIVERVKDEHPEFDYTEDVFYVRVTLGAIPETMNTNRPRYRHVYGLLYRSDLDDWKEEDWNKFLGDGKKYTARLLQTNKQRDGVEVFELHVAYEASKDPEYGLENGCIGTDVNPKFCNLAYTLANGRLAKWETEPHPLMEYASANKRDHEANRVARLIVEKAYAMKMGIIVEDMRFYQKKGSRKFNRMAHNFAHRKIIEAIIRHACEQGVPIYAVNPAFTSVIGRIKYQNMYGFSVHHGAAYVIARRGLGLKEKIPKFIHKGLKKYIELGGKLYNPTGKYNSWQLWSILGKISKEHPDIFIK